MRSILLYIAIFCALVTTADSLDSLRQSLSTSGSDEQKAKTWMAIGKYYTNKMPDSALVYYKKALPLLSQLPDDQVVTLQSIGVQFDLKNDFDSAIHYLSAAYELSSKHDFPLNMAKISNSLGVVAYRKGLYEKAISYYLRGLTYAEKINDTSLIVKLNDNVGHIFYYQNEFANAEKHYSVGLQYGEAKHNPFYIGNASMNLGYLQFAQEHLPEAMALFRKAADVFEKEQDLYWLSNAYQNIAIVANRMEQFGEAENYYLKSLEIFEKTGQQEGIAQTYVNLGDMFNDQGNPDKAIEYFKKGEEICQQIGVLEGLKYAYQGLRSAYELKGDYKQALYYQVQFSSIKDSLLNEQSINQIHELETQYESEKKQRQIEVLNKEKALSDIRLEKQNQFIWAVSIVLLLALGMLAMLAWAFIQKRKMNKVLSDKNNQIAEVNEELNQQNEEIAAQRDEIERQKNVLEWRNKEVADSINVAERIQRAFFTSEDKEKERIPDHLVIFQPRDVVSGDFYWSHFAEDNGHTIMYLSVVDCTGHGVPGAFMSMLGLSFINEILIRQPLIDPGQLLDLLMHKVVRELGQGDHSNVKEGMDMAVVRINLTTRELVFAGANNAVYYSDNDQLYELKPTKQAIGYTAHPVKFENTTITLPPKAMIYLFSDGFPDQFGGVDSKKLGYKRFRELLWLQSKYDVKEQQKHLQNFLRNWMEKEEQIDDITILGLRI